MSARKKIDLLPSTSPRNTHHSGIPNAVVPDLLMPMQTFGERFASWVRRNRYVIIGVVLVAAGIFFYAQSKAYTQQDMTYSFIETFSFWALADAHLAKDYKAGSRPSTFCTSGTGSAGKYGAYDCDTPGDGTLLKSALSFMGSRSRAGVYKTPTFVLYLGDSSTLYSEHPPQQTETMEQVKENVESVADMLTQQFGRNVFPTLGNHDNHPSAAMPLPPSAEYAAHMRWAADVWGARWLGNSAVKTVKKGGYYYADVLPTLRLISLNTNLLSIESVGPAHSNSTVDYAGQLSWLEKTIRGTPKAKRIIVFGHIPPYENVGTLKVMWTPHAISQYKRILTRHGARISAQIFGHLHKDTFLNMKFGEVKAPYAMVVPSLTPRTANGGAAPADSEACTGKNPALRMFTIKYTTGEVIDYTQYYLNLTLANTLAATTTTAAVPKWRKAYSLTEAYKVNGTSVEDFDAVVDAIEKDEKFCEFAKHMYSEQCPGKRATKKFKATLLCSLMNNVLDDAGKYGYDSCIKSSSVSDDVICN